MKHTLTVQYSENQGIWTISIDTWSKTVYSLDDVKYHIARFNAGVSSYFD